MKNYKDSDFARNKYSQGIVYKFANGSLVEITLQDYLMSNPDKTVADFVKLKALSDKIYQQQVTDENRANRRNISLNNLEETQLATPSFEMELLQMKEEQAILEAINKLLNSEKITKVQRKRFIKYFCEGYSYRQIAIMEGVHHVTIRESVEAVLRKIKRNLHI